MPAPKLWEKLNDIAGRVVVLFGQARIKEADAAGNMAGPLLAQAIGGGEGSFGGDLFLAFAVAASANLPTILFSLYWKRFNTTGAVVGILVGLIGSLLMVALGPNVMGPKGLFLKGSDPLFPLENPGIFSIPLGFVAAWLGTMLSREPASEELYEELRVRALTGLGAEEAEAAPAAAPRTSPASRPSG